MAIKKLDVSARRAQRRKAKLAKASEYKGLSLPDSPREMYDDLTRYATLLYGRPGIGKTTWAASWPDTVFFSTERVTKGIANIYDFNADNGGVYDWEVFRKGVELLEADDRFKMVVVDTVDAAYAHALRWVCAERGITHPEDEGYGKGWSAVRNEFISQMQRIAETGRGIIFTSHAKEVNIVSQAGGEFTRIKPTAANQAYDVLQQITDLTFYAEYLRDIDGNVVRVLITIGDEIVDAKNSISLPRFLPLTQTGGYSILDKALRGEDVGLDPDTLMPTRGAGQGIKNVLKDEKKRKDRPTPRKRRAQ